MDKTTSVLAAIDAGKLPSTVQFNAFILWLHDIGITSVPAANLTSQGRILADRIRDILEAYKLLLSNKNGIIHFLSKC